MNYQKILGYFNITSGRGIVVLIISLLLAFAIWMIHNLSSRYSEFVQVNIVAHSDLKGFSDESINSSELVARCRTTGYNILSSNYLSVKSVVDLKIPASLLTHKGGDMFYVLTSDLSSKIKDFWGSDVEVEYFVTDTLFFRFPYEDFKVVPVIPELSILYDNQYIPEGGFVIEPDSVLVYGDPEYLSRVESVKTKPIRKYDVTGDFHGEIQLESIRGLRIDVSKVRYMQKVTRFVEINSPSAIEVKTANVPEGKEMLVYPSKVDITIRCAYPLVEDPFKNIVVYADYNDYMSSSSGKCVLKVSDLSVGVLSYEIFPKVAGCVITDM